MTLEVACETGLLGDPVERYFHEASDVTFDEEFQARAERRRAAAWARIVNRSAASADEPDDPDEAASSASERVALVDTLMLISVRNGASDGTEPRLQRSVSRVVKRRR
jgi:hypothetical protein